MNNTKIKKYTQQLSKDISIHYFYPEPKNIGSKKEVVEDLILQIQQNENFELGEYPDENSLKEDLLRKIFGSSSSSEKLISLQDKHMLIHGSLKNAFQKCFDVFKVKKNITIYVIPFCNPEASKDLDGVNASPVEENILYLFIDLKNPKWERSLIETIPHEYAHLAYTLEYPWNSILDGIINEGLAEKFRETVVGGTIAPWSKVFTKEEALLELGNISEEKLNLFINEENIDEYLKYFFGTDELPKWYGYSLGYWLIDELIIEYNMNVLDLFKISPKEILKLWKK